MSSQRFRVASGSVANAVQMGIGFVTIILFSRLLGPAEIGIYFFILSVVSTTDGLINGLIAACRKRIPEEGSNVPELLGILTYGVVPIALVGGAVVAGALIALGITDMSKSLLIFVAFAPFVASTAGTRAIVGLERVDLAKWLQTARTVVRVIIQAALIAGGFGAVGMVVGHAAAMTIAAVAAFAVIRIVPLLPASETIESVWEFARYSIPSGMVSRIDESADEMLVGILFAAGAVGKYGVAVRLVAPALLLPSVIQGSLSARLSRLESQGKNVSDVLRRNVAFSGVLSIPIFFGALALGNHIIVTVFGSEYAGAGPILVVLAASRVIKSWASPMTSAIVGLDRPRAEFVINIVSAATLLIGAPAAAVIYGPVGIAGGILVTMLFRLIACLTVLSEYAAFRDLVPIQFGEQIAAGFVMYLIVAWMDTWFITDWITVIFTVGTGFIVYSTTLFIISSEVRSMLLEVLEQTHTWHS